MFWVNLKMLIILEMKIYFELDEVISLIATNSMKIFTFPSVTLGPFGNYQRPFGNYQRPLGTILVSSETIRESSETITDHLGIIRDH